MFSLQGIAIAIVAAFVIGLSGGSYFGWTLTQDYYSAKIANTEAKAKSALLVEQAKLITQERKNSDTTKQLEALSVEYSNKRIADAAAIRGLLADKSKWLRNPTTCKDATGTPAATPSTSVEQAPTSYFSEEFQGYLDAAIRESIEASDYAKVAHEYAKQIEAQRERMLKDE